jgi:4-amino-4-deoxy-L-arabinose transferase-like glycosyltransferase
MTRMPRSVLAGLVVLTALRFAIGAFLPLGDDETFYWEWSRHLAAGYVDHPPAIAYLVWAATHLAGATPFAIHALAAFLSFLTSLVLWVLARDVLGHDAGATWSVILFNVIPVFAGGALFAAPDAPLGLCWVLTLLWAWRAAQRAQGHLWVWAGAALGAGCESKYTAAVLPFSLGLWLVLSPSRRQWLRRPEPYVGLALAVLLTGPVLWWNATHAWASIAFTLIGRPHWSGGGNFAVFLASQFVYLGPLMFPALLGAVVCAARRGVAGEDRWLFLAAAALPLIAGLSAASLFGQVKGHWPAPGYVTATIGLAGLATERPWAVRSRAWRGAAAAVLASTILLTGLIHALPSLGPYLLPPRLDPTVDSYGWTEAAREIAAVARRDAHGPYFFMAEQYQVMAQFDFSTGGRYPATTITGTDQYALWTRWADLRGRDGLFISDERYPPTVDVSAACRAIDREPNVSILRRGVVVRTLGIAWCRGFSGRPAPPLPSGHPAPDLRGPGGKISRGRPRTAGAAGPDLRE